MNLEIGAEDALFSEKEYINGIAVAVQTHECGNGERRQTVSFLGIHKSDLVCTVYIA
jgi:hypothetical protein